MTKIFIEKGHIFFNSNSKGLIDLGHFADVACFGIEEMPSGWTLSEILCQMPNGRELENSAAAIQVAYETVGQDLADKLFTAFKGGSKIQYKTWHEDSKFEKHYGGGGDTASWTPQSDSVFSSSFIMRKSYEGWFIDNKPAHIIEREDTLKG
jgi:hypothetical protein